MDAPGGGLARLEAEVRRDLFRIAHPYRPWLTPRTGPDGRPALDVLVAGAGQSGVAVGFALLRSKVDNILLVDRADEGMEGPWRTYARMPTLRSPKDFTGPDLDIPSLTYEAWHEARYGRASWEALDLIAREDWADYLLWVRRVTGVPVRNRTALTAIAPAGDLLAATLCDEHGERTVYARKIVLATGQESTGRWWLPPEIEALPAHLRAHTADPIDFAALAGRTVVVLGMGASALDNAATALEAGADVTLLCRRAEPQVVQPYRWLTFRGFLRHLGDLPDDWRWRLMRHILSLREGFPQATWDRCARHAGFRLVTGAPVTRAWADDRVHLETPPGTFAGDLVIAGTGIENEFALRPELANFAGNIATWGDRYTPPAEERDDRLARFPYLAPDYAFTETRPGETPWIRNVHLFSIGSTMSFGASGSSINAMTTAVPRLVDGLTRGLFTGDLAAHWASLAAYDVPQATIPAEWLALRG
jgi:cation diffusion facilitator CzcD-associated flavoprotein CzcO